MNAYFVGVDLGQVRDFTAIAVVARAEEQGDWDAAVFARRKVVRLQLRYLERVPLGTTYPEVVRRVARLTRSRELAGRCRLVVDGTGVGRPVVDLLRREGPGCTIMPVTITVGRQETQSGGYYGIPKGDLVTRLQVLLQEGGLQIAAEMEWGATLTAEMASMDVKVTGAGREQYGAWREGQHDDLVFAVALACWGVKKVYPRERDGWMQREAEADLGKILRGM